MEFKLLRRAGKVSVKSNQVEPNQVCIARVRGPWLKLHVVSI